MSWERQKRAMEKMTPEELAAFKAKRAQQQREAWKRRTDRKRANGELPPEPIRGRPRPTKVQIAAAKAKADAEREAKRAERAEQYAKRRAEQKRLRRQDEMQGSLDEFLAKGAQEGGFSAFLRSKEVRIADQITRPRGDIAA